MSRIVVIGDLMLDKYSYGLVKRLNPEWPTPLLNINREEYKLWWAANVASNIASLNGFVDLIWVLWEDDYGEKFLSLCQEEHIQLTHIVTGVSTITKQRFVETTYQHQLLRVDYEEKYLMSQSHSDMVISALQEISPEYIVFSDYNKWIIDKYLVDWIKSYAQKNNVKIFVDTKPDNLKYFENVYLIKPNLKEFRQMIGNEELPDSDEALQEQGILFVNQYKTNLVITRWSKWAVLITQEGEFYSLPTQAKQVFDVTGAWDTFLAAIVCSLALGSTLVAAVELGNKASWIVVGKQGTVSITSQELGL